MSPAPTLRTTTFVVVVSVACLVATYLSIIRLWGALVVVGVQLWYILHGVALARRLMQSHSTAAHWFFGPVWGVGLSLLGLLALWEMGAHGLWILLVGPWPIWILLRLPPARLSVALRLPAFGRRDFIALAWLLLIVPVIVARPYARVAEPIDGGGKAYRAYFTADFVWAMTVVAEVSKGDLPPKNPFQLGGTLHYYWLAHFLPSVEYRIFRPRGLTIEELSLGNSVMHGLVFVTFLYGFVRAFGASTLGAAAACALLFFANSFEVLDRIVAWWREPEVFPLLTVINIDAVTRWFYQGMPVDGMHRMLLYQPHHLAGYALGLSALLVVSRAADASRPMVALVAGSFLGLSLLLTTFTALIFGVAVSAVYAVRLLFPPRWISIPICAALGALPVAGAYFASRSLAYVDPQADRLIEFGLNPVAGVHWPYALFLSFGPLLILGAVGMAVSAWTRRSEAWPIGALAGVAVLFYFFTDVPDMQHVWVGWRAGHLLFLACAVFTGILLSASQSARPPMRLATWSCAALLAVAALPTVAMDVYNAQDISNGGNGPGFPWTLRLSGYEVEALEWLKAHTPPDVIVQPDVRERANASWGYMPAFGERRMAAGLPIAMIPIQPYIDATEVVGREIFETGSSPAQRSAAARGLGVDYLWVGPAEQKRHKDLVATLDSRSDLFPVLFRNPDVVIYWVAP